MQRARRASADSPLHVAIVCLLREVLWEHRSTQALDELRALMKAGHPVEREPFLTYPLWSGRRRGRDCGHGFATERCRRPLGSRTLAV
jgi:hypothetical protein